MGGWLSLMPIVCVRVWNMSEHYHFTNERKELRVREQRLVYLITYSRADFNKITSREAFAKAVIQGFTTTTAAGVVHWVVLFEMHANSSDSYNANDFHYHMALKGNCTPSMNMV